MNVTANAGKQDTTSISRKLRLAAVLAGCILMPTLPAVCAPDEPTRSKLTPQLTGVFVLPRTSLDRLGNPACSNAALEKARRNGLAFTDLPSIGSGLAKVGENEFVGITDRGPNGKGESDDADAGLRRTFPLPQFCPTVVRFKLTGEQIRITGCVPLTDSQPVGCCMVRGCAG